MGSSQSSAGKHTGVTGYTAEPEGIPTPILQDSGKNQKILYSITSNKGHVYPEYLRPSVHDLQRQKKLSNQVLYLSLLGGPLPREKMLRPPTSIPQLNRVLRMLQPDLDLWYHDSLTAIPMDQVPNSKPTGPVDLLRLISHHSEPKRP